MTLPRYQRPGLDAVTATWLRTMRASDQPKWAAYVHALRDAGWTAREVAAASGVSHQRVSQVYARPADPAAVPVGVPAPGSRRRPPPPPKPPRPTVTPDQARELRGLFNLAVTVNGATPPDDPRRAASARLSELLAAYMDAGMTGPHLAGVLGVRHTAVYQRLSRFGYRQAPPSMTARYHSIPPREEASTR